MNRTKCAWMVPVGCGIILSSTAAAPPMSTEHAALVAEAMRVRNQIGDQVWPGMSDLHPPLVLQVEEWQYLVGFPDAVDGFESIEAPAPLSQSVQVGPRSHSMDLAASFPMYGQPAVVIATPEVMGWSPNVWVCKAAHEMFHVLQMHRGEFEKVASLEIGPTDDAMWQLNFAFPYDDEAATGLIHQQAWACYTGTREDEETIAEARYAAGVAVEATEAMRAYLSKSGAPEKSAEYAQFQEWKEGVAKWVEREFARVAAETGSQPLEAFTKLDGATSYRQCWDDEYAGQVFLAKHAGRAARSRTMLYHLGLAKAMLLEKLDPTWKEAYFEPDVWLTELLEQVAAGKKCSELNAEK